MKFIDLFAGIGGFHSGLENAGMKCVGWCEIDKFARKSYEAIYDTTELWTATDIRFIRGWDMPKADLWSFGFPCQDISIAGKQQGIKRGTRSGLYFEVMRLLDEAGENKPKWIIAENVKNLMSIRGGWEFFTVIAEMEKRGYSIEWNIYNSKNYGVPQNRERVYIVGYLGNTGRRKILPTPRAGEKGIRQIGNFINRRKNQQCGRVYDIDGIGPTLRANTGGFSEPYIRVVGQIGKNKQRGRIFADDGIVGELSACDYKDPLKVLDGDRIRKLTPLECWRLQGFSDEQFYKASKVNSNSQLYRQAGNSVTVPVVEEIGKAIMEYEMREGI